MPEPGDTKTSRIPPTMFRTPTIIPRVHPQPFPPQKPTPTSRSRIPMMRKNAPTTATKAAMVAAVRLYMANCG